MKIKSNNKFYKIGNNKKNIKINFRQTFQNNLLSKILYNKINYIKNNL